jgi:hypothetical protein
MADVSGHGVAAQELMASTRPRSYHSSHSQFDTIRKLRSAFVSLLMAPAQGASYNLSSGRDSRGNSIILTDWCTESEWLKRFSQDMRKRMGQDVRPQLGFLCGGHGDASQIIRRPMEGSAKREREDIRLDPWSTLCLLPTLCEETKGSNWTSMKPHKQGRPTSKVPSCGGAPSNG